MTSRVYVFDFDGTLTRSDTLIEFIRYVCGDMRCLLGFVLYSPLLVLMKLHLYPNYAAKRHIFTHFFGGMSIEKFNAHCANFARDRQDLWRDGALTELHRISEEGSDIYVVSASIDNWVRPFIHQGADGSIQVLGTQIEVVNGHVTGRFLTPNCYGAEKVRRISEVLTDRDKYEMIAYGDSRGDKELLSYADKGIYKPFR